MRKNFFLNKLVFLFALSVFSGCVNSDSGQSGDRFVANIKNTLEQGKAVIVYKMLNKDRTSEQYADWSANLNDFMSSKSKSYKVYESDKDFDLRYLAKHTNTDESYTLFIKKGKPSYLYNGVIVEPMVYIAVNNAYSKNKISSVDKAFLPDNLVVDIKWIKNKTEQIIDKCNGSQMEETMLDDLGFKYGNIGFSGAIGNRIVDGACFRLNQYYPNYIFSDVTIERDGYYFTRS